MRLIAVPSRQRLRRLAIAAIVDAEVTNSVCAIVRLFMPAEAKRATRSSLALNASMPLRAMRRGRAPLASRSQRQELLSRFPFLAPAHRLLRQGHGNVNTPPEPNIP